jgi:hypothetical protein
VVRIYSPRLDLPTHYKRAPHFETGFDLRGRHRRGLLHDLLKPHFANVVVCDPRKKALLKAGNKNDRIDTRKLANLLRTGLLSPVYHGESGVRTLKELAPSYLTITKDLTRAMNRIKGLYRRLLGL